MLIPTTRRVMTHRAGAKIAIIMLTDGENKLDQFKYSILSRALHVALVGVIVLNYQNIRHIFSDVVSFY